MIPHPALTIGLVLSFLAEFLLVAGLIGLRRFSVSGPTRAILGVSAGLIAASLTLRTSYHYL